MEAVAISGTRLERTLRSDSGQGPLPAAGGPHPQRPSKTLLWPSLGSYPTARAWPRAPASVPSSAGREACRGLTRGDMEIASSHPGPCPGLSHLPRKPAPTSPPPRVPSRERWPCLSPVESQSGLLFTSTRGLCSRGTLPPEPSQQQAACQSQQNQECSRAGTPDLQALCPGDPGMQTQSRLPAFAQPSAIGCLQSPAGIYPTMAQANFLQLTFMARELFVAAPTPSSQKLPSAAPTLGDLRGGVYSGVSAS